jgi:soluble lytic murein transglycosylase-like protein
MSRRLAVSKLGKVAIDDDRTGAGSGVTVRDLLFVAAGIVLASVIYIILTMINHAQAPLRPQTATIDSPWIPSTVKHWQGQIDANAKKYDIDPTFLAIIMTLESGGNPKANSGEAKGLMQITPVTAKDIAGKYLKKPVTKYDLYDPATSIEFGAAYLSYLRTAFTDYTQAPTYDLAAEAVGAGYNGGPSATVDLLQGKGIVNEQTVLYSRNVLYFWRERHASSSPAYLRWRDEAGGIRLIQAAEKNQ